MVALDNKSGIGFKAGIPFISTVILILLMQLHYKIPYINNIFPYFSLLAIYYWCIFKPNLMPMSAVFFLGLFQDILSGGPLGMTALCFILIRVFVIAQSGRFLEREFLFNWLVFIMVSIVYGFLNWAIASLYLKETQNLWNSLGQSLLTIAIFPFLSLMLSWVNKFLATENR
ncbi:MAG: rod shape-determining protein MreD [Emcibacter sp.]|nr:rod shape-determining protein MreD [Emcibacter sp.]